MGAFLSWLGAFMESKIGSIVVQLCLAMGISFTSYKFGIEPFQNFISQQLAGMSGVVAQVMGFLGFGIAISMMLSAVAAKFATRGMKAVLSKKGV
jgi:Protein of unknown function (DUF2523)